MSKQREGIKVNLPREVYVNWEKARQGYPHTLFAMGGLAAYLLLDVLTRQELMARIAAVDEGKVSWTHVMEWIERRVTEPPPDLRDLQTADRILRGLGLQPQAPQPADSKNRSSKNPKTPRP